MRPRSVVAPPARVALFADVDGTLLDSRQRLAMSAAGLDVLRGEADVILASSRTLVELATIQQQLGLVAPLIAENGAVISIPPRWRGSPIARREVIALGEPAASVRARVQRCVVSAKVRVTDQRDVLPGRARAIRRTHSVCVRNWRGAGAERFLRVMDEDGLLASRSGTWITITLGADKGVAARTVLALAARRDAGYARTVAIGNAANDAPMLAAVELGFAIRNPRRGHEPALLALNGVRPLSASGARAWRDALAMIPLSSTGRR